MDPVCPPLLAVSIGITPAVVAVPSDNTGTKCRRFIPTHFKATVFDNDLHSN
jgi:hypothetical protein